MTHTVCKDPSNCVGSEVETRLLTETVSDFSAAAAVPTADTHGLTLIFSFFSTVTPGQLQGFQDHNDIMDVLAEACDIIGFMSARLRNFPETL